MNKNNPKFFLDPSYDQTVFPSPSHYEVKEDLTKRTRYLNDYSRGGSPERILRERNCPGHTESVIVPDITPGPAHYNVAKNAPSGKELVKIYKARTPLIKPNGNKFKQ